MDNNSYDTILNKLQAEKERVEILVKEYVDFPSSASFHFKGEIFAYDKIIKIIKEVIFQR